MPMAVLGGLGGPYKGLLMFGTVFSGWVASFLSGRSCGMLMVRWLLGLMAAVFQFCLGGSMSRRGADGGRLVGGSDVPECNKENFKPLTVK